MAGNEFTVTLSPVEAQELLDINLWEKQVFSDVYKLGQGIYIFITVYEKYYMRNGSTAGLVIICENTTGSTLVKVNSIGSGEGIFNIDWGAGEDFVDKVKDLISDYII